MKRKKTPVPKAAEMAVETAAAEPISQPGSRTCRDTVTVALLSLVLLAAMTIQTGAMTHVLSVLALVSVLWKGSRARLSGRLCVPVQGFVFLAVMQGLAAIYTPFEESGVGEYYKFLAAFSVAVLYLVWAERRHIRAVLWGMLSVSGVIALISIDGAGCALLWNAFETMLQLFGTSVSVVAQYSGAARVAGIYNDANITASIFALATLLGLYLLGTGEGKKSRLSASLLLGLNALVCLLSLSRAAILCFGLALLVWLAVAGKGERLALFIRMVLSAAAVLAMSMVVTPFLSAASPLATLLALLTGLPVFLLDWAVTERLVRVLSGRGKLLAAAGGGLAVAVVVLAALAMHRTGPYSFTGDGALLRAVKLDPGAYTLTADVSGGAPTVSIYNQSAEQAMMELRTEYYTGELDGAEFTVAEEDGGYTYFVISASAGTTLESVTLSDGSKLPLRYKLLPASVADRLQGGLFGGSSTTLRVQFMKDAWTIFLQSPILGHGLAATEGLYCSVQPFFYQSRYVHNHILQVMTDMGLLGLAGFLTLIGGVLWLLVRRLRQEESDPLAALLTACWVMMVSHAMMEFTFSIRGYQCFAYVLLLLPAVLYGQSPGKGKKALRRAGTALAVALGVYLAVFGGLLLSHRMVEREAQAYEAADISEFLDAVQSMVRRDVFTGDQYRMLYVRNALLSDDHTHLLQMQNYAAQLRATGTYNNCATLSSQYYMSLGEYQAAFNVSREGLYNMFSNSQAWNNQLKLYYESFLPFLGAENVAFVVEGTQALRAMKTEYEETHWDTLDITEENLAWMDAVDTVAAQGLTGEAAYTLLLVTAHSLSDHVVDYGR